MWHPDSSMSKELMRLVSLQTQNKNRVITMSMSCHTCWGRNDNSWVSPAPAGTMPVRQLLPLGLVVAVSAVGVFFLPHSTPSSSSQSVIMLCLSWIPNGGCTYWGTISKELLWISGVGSDELSCFLVPQRSQSEREKSSLETLGEVP